MWGKSRLILALLILLSGPPVWGAYKITKVIEIGPANREMAKWSPDGYRVAYPCDMSMCVCDSLGNSLNKIPLPNRMERYEWLSDGEVTALLVNRYNENGAYYIFYQMTVIDVITGEISILREFTRGPGFDPSPESFSGPFKTPGGVPYYRTNVVNRGRRRIKSTPMGIVFPEPRSHNYSAYITIDSQYLGQWGEDGLYKVRANFKDSLLIGPKPFSNINLPTAIRKDWMYYMYGGAIYSVADAKFIVLDTIFKEFPPGTSATSIMFQSFNPVETEVLFRLKFTDGEDYYIKHIATYNYVTGETVILDREINMQDCQMPAYSSEGRNITFWSQGKAYILYREEI